MVEDEEEEVEEEEEEEAEDEGPKMEPDMKSRIRSMLSERGMPSSVLSFSTGRLVDEIHLWWASSSAER